MVSRSQFAGLLGVIFLAGIAQWARQPDGQVPTFQEIRPSVYKLNYLWSMIPGFPRMPVGSWLIESSTLISPKSWTLIDTGTDVPANQQALVQGIKAKLASSGGTLKLILLTHGHGDHVSGLPQVLEAFPQAQVAFHELEEPFITGGAQYNQLDGDHALYNFAHKGLPPQNSTLLPSSEAIKLQGSSGDIASYVSWMSKDVLHYYHAPGHSPGMAVFYHTPTKSMIAADSFMHVSNYFPFSNALKIEPGIPLRLVTPSLQTAKKSLQQLAAIPKVDTYFASHDCKAGASAESFKHFVSTLEV